MATKFSDVIGSDQLLVGTKFSLDFLNVPTTVVNTQKLKLYCKGSELPDQDIEVVDGKIGDFPVKMPNNIANNLEWQVTILEDSKGSMYPMLFAWKEMSLGTETGFATEGYNQAKAIQTVYNIYGKPASKIEIFNIWPKTVPSVKPSIEGNSPIEYQVTFVFSRYKPVSSTFR